MEFKRCELSQNQAVKIWQKTIKLHYGKCGIQGFSRLTHTKGLKVRIHALVRIGGSVGSSCPHVELVLQQEAKPQSLLMAMQASCMTAPPSIGVWVGVKAGPGLWLGSLPIVPTKLYIPVGNWDKLHNSQHYSMSTLWDNRPRTLSLDFSLVDFIRWISQWQIHVMWLHTISLPLQVSQLRLNAPLNNCSLYNV